MSDDKKDPTPETTDAQPAEAPKESFYLAPGQEELMVKLARYLVNYSVQLAGFQAGAYLGLVIASRIARRAIEMAQLQGEPDLLPEFDRMSDEVTAVALSDFEAHFRAHGPAKGQA